MRIAKYILDVLPLPAFFFELETRRFLAANVRLLDLLGYSTVELLGMTVDQIQPREDLQRLENALQSYPPEGATERRYLRKDGSLLYVRILYRNNELVEDGIRRCARLVVVESWGERPTQSAQQSFSE